MKFPSQGCLLGGGSLVLALTILALIPAQTTAIEPFTASIGLGVAAVGGLYQWGYSGLYCFGNECADDRWIPNNITKIELLLNEHVYGQHLVQSVVLRALRSHLRRKSRAPKKALTMSFHGFTGSGKNYVARFIAEGIYREGMKSNFVHLFVATLHFPHAGRVDEYKLQLQDWIRGNVTLAPQSLFIFDEIDKMPEGVIDAIKPFIDHHEMLDGVDYRRCTFLFLSNTGGKAITQRTLQLWKEGKAREDLKMEDYEELINTGAFNEKGGLRHSALLESSLINHFVPFLPMERQHVRKCVEFEGKDRSLLEEDIELVLNQLQYYPADEQLYATTGCKKVHIKVEQILEGYLDRL